MAASMKGSGWMDKEVDKERFGTVMGISIKDSGKETKPVVQECTVIKMARFTKENGSTINSMDTDARHGTRAHHSKGFSLMALKRAQVLTNGPMGPHLKGNGLTTKLTDKVSTDGLMVDVTKAPGVTTICTGTAFIRGPTAGSTKAITLMTRSTAQEFTGGPMVVNTTVSGHTVNNTAKVSIPSQQAKNGLEFGKKVKDKNGLIDVKISY